MKADIPFLLTGNTTGEIQTIPQAKDPQLASELASNLPPVLGYVALMAKAKIEQIDVDDLLDSLRQEALLRTGPASQQAYQTTT